MEFLILNRQLVETISPEIPYIVIGATEPKKSKPQINKNKWYISDLRLYYSDILKEDACHYPVGHLFMKDQARLIINFFRRHRQNAELCICQCDGGVSRSSATAAFLTSICGKSPRPILDNPMYAPNEHVYNLLHEVYRREYIWNTQFSL